MTQLYQEPQVAEIDRLRAEVAALVAERDQLKALVCPDESLDELMERWDQTDHELQRKFVASLGAKLIKAETHRARLMAGLRWISESVFFKPQLVRWGADSILAGADLDDPAQAEQVWAGTWRAKG